MSVPGRAGVWRDVARLHASGIDRGFLSRLGPAFLVQLYRAIDESPGGIVLAEHKDGRIVGFVAGSVGTTSLSRRLLRHPVALAASLLPVAWRPSVWRGVLETIRHAAPGEPAGLPKAELLSLAVDPDHRREGIAERLYRQLQQEFQHRGCPRFRIVVGDSLVPAHRFYRTMGARPEAAVILHRGAKSTIYVQDARPEPTSGTP